MTINFLDSQMSRLFSLYFTSFWIFHFHIFWILHFHIFCILHCYIFCILHFHIFCILHFYIFTSLRFHIFTFSHLLHFWAFVFFIFPFWVSFSVYSFSVLWKLDFRDFFCIDKCLSVLIKDGCKMPKTRLSYKDFLGLYVFGGCSYGRKTTKQSNAPSSIMSYSKVVTHHYCQSY